MAQPLKSRTKSLMTAAGVALIIGTILFGPSLALGETEQAATEAPKQIRQIEQIAPTGIDQVEAPVNAVDQDAESEDALPTGETEAAPDSDDVSAETRDAAVEAAGPVELTGWRTRVQDFLEAFRIGEKDESDADALFAELDSILWQDMRSVRTALEASDPAALEMRERLERMYQARIQLSSVISPKLKTALGGGGKKGMREVRHEFEYAQLNYAFQALAIPRALKSISADIKDSPLDDLAVLLQILALLFACGMWRRWAKKGLPDLRKRLLALRPRRPMQLRLAKLLWYIDRCRKPIEWLILLFCVSSRYEPGDLEEIEILVSSTLIWLLLARFGILLIDAMAVRSSSRAGSMDSALRLRSLRLVAAWLLLLGLGLDLTSRYTGEGAIYIWVWRILMLLMIPALGLLLHWWRKEIISRLEQEARQSPWAQRRVARKGIIASYTTAAAGGVFLLSRGFLQSIIRGMSEFESGRRAVAVLLRRELDRDTDQDDRADEEPISEELAAQLLLTQSDPIEKPTRAAMREVLDLIEGGRGGTLAILAERGFGLSTFLSQLSEKFEGKIPVVDFPIEGIPAFRIALAKQIGLDGHEDLATSLGPRLDELGIRAIAIDNFHRLPRPQMGGLTGMDEVSKIAEFAGEDILWLVAVNRSSWPYITRARGDLALVQDMIELPPWTESQLQELFDARCDAVGIAPDYRRLAFPRQFDDGEPRTLEERNRAGFRRVLWDLSGGNPEIAMRLFAKSLRGIKNDKFVLRMPQPQPATEVNEARLTTLLVLRVIAQCDLATIENITSSLRLTRATVLASLRFSLQRGWVDEVDGRYRISWDWFRTVITVLVRRNLLPR